MNLIVHPFLTPRTGATSYVALDPGSRSCAVIDPLHEHADAIVALVGTNGLVVQWILHTGPTVEKSCAGRELKRRFLCAQRGAPAAGPGENGSVPELDRTFAIGDRVWLGHGCGRVVSAPEQRVGRCCYVFDDLAFVGEEAGAAFASGGMRVLGRRIAPSRCGSAAQSIDRAPPTDAGHDDFARSRAAAPATLGKSRSHTLTL